MADAPETPETEELLLTEEVQPETPETPETDEGEDAFTFGDESEPQDGDTNLVKHLRQQIREAHKRVAELEKSPKPQAVDPGPEPTLESCDYDEDKYRVAIREYDKKVAEASKPAADADAELQAQWQRERNRYVEGKSKLGYPDVEDAEETVKAALSPAQQTALVLAAEDPAKMMYALYKNPARLAELAAETNPVKLAAKCAKLEGQLKMVKRRAIPEIDTPERGSGQISKASADKTLAKLEAEAERTGDRSKVIKYKRELRKAQR